MISSLSFFRSFMLLITCLANSFTAFAASSNSPFTVNQITLKQITDDITFLASDELKGRGNYSKELNLAATYIANRFKESGLTGTKITAKQKMLQPYQIKKVTPETLSMIINEQPVAIENLAIVSTANAIKWQLPIDNKNNYFTLHQLNKNDKINLLLAELNNLGGNHVILTSLEHQNTFKQYQHYFQQGTTKLIQNDDDKSHASTIVMALTNTRIQNVKNIKIEAQNTTQTYQLNNVVAVLPGKTKPHEIILYSAHYDHLGVKSSNVDNSFSDSTISENTIYNGADDDASGVTAIINIAQYYAKQGRNARTLMFAAFSAEEIGGYGSQYFSTQIDPNTITAMINIEMIGKPSKYGAGSVWMTGMEHSNLGQLLNKALTKQNKKIHKDPYPEQNLFYRSDNATLAKLGVPAHSFSSSQLDNDHHYHQTSDDLSSINFSSLHKVIQTLILATEPLANGEVTPTRIDSRQVKTKGLIF